MKDDRKQPAAKERSNVADRGSTTDRRESQRRSGEGAQSALANLKNIERDRQKSRPADDEGGAR